MALLLLLAIMTIRCSKCSGIAWVEIQHTLPILRCRCGLTEVLRKSDGDMTMTHTPIKSTNYSLPQPGTKLSKILGCLGVLGDMSSNDLADQMGISYNSAATNLSILRSRGLVRATVEGRGKKGGSTWSLEPAIRKHYQER